MGWEGEKPIAGEFLLSEEVQSFTFSVDPFNCTSCALLYEVLLWKMLLLGCRVLWHLLGSSLEREKRYAVHSM